MDQKAKRDKVLLVCQDATPSSPGWHRDRGYSKPPAEEQGWVLKATRRNLVHQYRFSLASLGGGCALNQTPLSSSVRRTGRTPTS